MTSRLPAGRRFTLLVAVLLASGIAVSYGGSFGIGFYFDGVFGIANNPAIRSLRNIPRFFVDPSTFWTVAEHDVPNDLRPLVVATYAVNYAISGLHPWSYHALNLIFHFLAALLVFVIV